MPFLGLWQDFPGGSDSKAYARNAGDSGSIPGSGRSLEKEMATHSSTLAWNIPWTEKPSGLCGVAKSWARLSRGYSLLRCSGFWSSAFSCWGAQAPERGLSACVVTTRSGNKLTQKDNADSGVQFITLVGPRQSLLLAKDPDQFL